MSKQRQRRYCIACGSVHRQNQNCQTEAKIQQEHPQPAPR